MTRQEYEILLVEDDPADAELTIHALRKERLANRIEQARDGAEALDFLFCRGAYADRTFDFPPRLVLLDLKLPKVSGHEVLRAIKADERTRAIPVVVHLGTRSLFFRLSLRFAFFFVPNFNKCFARCME